MGKVHMWCGSATGPVKDYWTETGSFANALLGYTISPAGDINEDGYDDFFMMYPAASKSGTVNLYLGSQNGPRNDVQLFAQGAVQRERRIEFVIWHGLRWRWYGRDSLFI